MKSTRGLVVLVGVALAASTSACSSEDQGAQQSVESGGDSPVPDFDGAWSDQFVTAYRNAATDAQRAILSDGVVTEAEYAEVRQGFVTCMADIGYVVVFDDVGGFTLDVPPNVTDDDQVQDNVARCDREIVGDVTLLYESIQRNPENADEHTIMADCLVREGVVDPGFSAEDYTEWFEDESPGARLPYIVDESQGESAFNSCNADPLGLFG